MMQPSLLRRVARKVDKTLASMLFLDQWVLYVGRDQDYRSLSWDALTPIVPEKDRYWGDPFILQRDGRYFIFVEEKLYASGMGRIACLEVDVSGRLLSHKIVLEAPYHLSYPFLVEQGDELLMIPESAAKRTIELYRCTEFPHSWQPVKVLLSGLYAVDATLLEYEDRVWLFTNVRVDGGSSLNALHLYWAENLLADTWHPHPLNPVVRDIGSARPAGRIFLQDGQLIRPSQDSSRRYGGALRFNRITRLDQEAYREEEVGYFKPRGTRLRATHTFNQAGELTVIDAVVRRRK